MFALEGITVIDVTQAEAGPRATMHLADMGADVIKIEPPTGEYTRPVTRKWDAGNGANAYFLSHNRNKRDIAFDYTRGEGREIMYKLIKKADVFVQSYSPGTAERHGYGYEDLRKINPGIIYASISGWGKKGPMNMRRGYDIVTQAASGLTHQNGEPGGPEMPAATGVVDHVTGLALAFGIASALYHRERTGEGQQLDCNLLQSAFYLLSVELCAHLLSGIPTTKSGRGHSMAAGLYYNFPCKDKWIAFGGVRNEPWTAMCQAMGLSHLITDPRFITTDDRVNNRDQLVPILDEKFKTRTAMEWTKLLEKAGAIVYPVMSIEDMLADPDTAAQIKANQMLVEVEKSGGGKTKVVGPIVNMEGTPCQVKLGDPAVGRDNYEIMHELGYTDDQIAKIYADGIMNSF